MPAPAIRMPRYAAPRLRSRTTLGGSSGDFARPIQNANSPSSTTATARKIYVDGVPQPCVAAFENP
jgi:hypothetical protein